MRIIRSQRRVLKEFRENETLTSSKYRYYYRKAKGGSYRSIADMKRNMELDGIPLGGEQ
jgi:large subunit ribosomal protein L19e